MRPEIFAIVEDWTSPDGIFSIHLDIFYKDEYDSTIYECRTSAPNYLYQALKAHPSVKEVGITIIKE